MNPVTVFIAGSNRGIGYSFIKSFVNDPRVDKVIACYRPSSQAEALHELKKSFPEKLVLFPCDATKEESVAEAKTKLPDSIQKIDLVVNSIGVLENDKTRPEKSIRDFNLAALLESITVNTATTLNLAKHLKPLIMASPSPRFVAISAKVGSIQDNSLGGWYSYRISKAAVNMAIKNLAVEFKRRKPSIQVFSLHPGTTHTQLSDKFVESAKKKYKVHTADETAKNLISVIFNEQDKHAKFINWDGKELPW